MIKHVTTNLITGQKAVNDSGFLTVKLPSAGGISGLELTARATNGAGGSASYGLLASITKIEIKTLHGQGILDMSGTELYRLLQLRTREAPQLSEGTGAGAVQVVKFPLSFALPGQDEEMGLDMAKYPDAELKVYYTLHVDAGDGFATKSFEIDLDARATQQMQPPGYKGLLTLAEAWHGTTQVQNPHTANLRMMKDVVGVYLYAYKSGTADNALIRNIKMETRPDKETIVEASFSDLQERSRPIAGAIVPSWLALWVAPGRLGSQALEPLGHPDIDIKLEELVADGAIKIFLEELRAA